LATSTICVAEEIEKSETATIAARAANRAGLRENCVADRVNLRVSRLIAVVIYILEKGLGL